MKHIVLIAVSGGLVQSVSVSLELAFDVQVIVRDYDCEERTDHPHIRQDSNGDFCEIQRWEEKDFAILTDRDSEFLEMMAENSS